jgi:malonyl-CoA/methylmalonyl-CoA synthetase
MSNQNLFVALRNAFPADLDSTAVETDDGLVYSWRDLDRATAMVANLLQSLDIPKSKDGVPPRVAVQVEKSVEAMVLYLATLRAGLCSCRSTPLTRAARSSTSSAMPSRRWWCAAARTFGWVSPIAFKAGTRHVFTLNDDRSGSLLERAAHCSDVQTPAVRRADDLAAILYTSGTTGRSKGAMLSHGNLLSNAVMLKDYWGWEKGDVLIHALPIFHVHGLFVAIHGALLNGSKDAVATANSTPKKSSPTCRVPPCSWACPRCMCACWPSLPLTMEQAAHMRLFISGSAPLLIETFNEWRGAPATPSWSATA